MKTVRLSQTRVGATETIEGWSGTIHFDTGYRTEDRTRVTMDAYDARQLAKKLKKWADLLDPPKKRKR